MNHLTIIKNFLFYFYDVFFFLLFKLTEYQNEIEKINKQLETFKFYKAK